MRYAIRSRNRSSINSPFRYVPVTLVGIFCGLRSEFDCEAGVGDLSAITATEINIRRQSRVRISAELNRRLMAVIIGSGARAWQAILAAVDLLAELVKRCRINVPIRALGAKF
jgi:hypothetical protein